MAYDVYVFMHVGGFLECCMCLLLDESGEGWGFQADSTEKMISHLKEHEKAGHKIPSDIYDNLRADDKENFV